MKFAKLILLVTLVALIAVSLTACGASRQQTETTTHATPSTGDADRQLKDVPAHRVSAETNQQHQAVTVHRPSPAVPATPQQQHKVTTTPKALTKPDANKPHKDAIIHTLPPPPPKID